MPPAAIGLPGTLSLNEKKVLIRAGTCAFEHDRLFGRNAISTIGEHRTALVAEVSGRRGKRYLKRQQLLDLGEVVYDYFTEIVHRKPRTWYADVDDLHDLLGRFGDALLREAIRQALEQQLFGAEYVAAFLPGIVTAIPTPTLLEEIQ